MWESVLLNDKHTLALLKAAVLAGDIKLIEPATADEKRQIDWVQKRINQSRLQDASLIYCLLAERVYLDGSNIGWDVFEETTNEGMESSESNMKSRFLLEKVSPDFRNFIEPTNSGLNFLAVEKRDRTSNPQEIANRIATLEPLIWRAFKPRDATINREELRLALDLLMFAPKLVGVHRSSENLDSFDRAVLEAASKKWPHIRLTKDQQQRLCGIMYVGITKASVATNQIAEAERLNAVYPIDNLTFGRNRYPRDMSRLKEVRAEDTVAAAKIFLKEIKFWPVVNGFADVIRLRQDRDFATFRDNFQLWVSTIVAGDSATEVKLRKDIQKANESLSKAKTCSKIGGIFTYLGLPLLFLDMFVAPVFGTPLTVAGFGLQSYSDWIKKKHRWTIIGRG